MVIQVSDSGLKRNMGGITIALVTNKIYKEKELFACIFRKLQNVKDK